MWMASETPPLVAELFLAYCTALAGRERARQIHRDLKVGTSDRVSHNAVQDGAVPRDWAEWTAWMEAVRMFESARFALECELRRHPLSRWFTVPGFRFCWHGENLGKKSRGRLIVEEARNARS